MSSPKVVRSPREAISSLRVRAMELGALAGVGRGLVAGLLVLVATAWVDLLAETSAATLIAAWVTAGLVAVAALALAVLRASWGATDPALARAVDTAAGTGGVVLTGVDLEGPDVTRQGATPCPDLTRGLAALAVGLAGQVAHGVRPGTVIPVAPALRPYASLGALGLALAAAAGLWPEALASQLARLTDPLGDHPPFSPTRLWVHPGAATVIYGDSLDVTVRVGGLSPERLELLVDTRAPSDPAALVMVREDEDLWRGRVPDIREPLTYHVRSVHGRSRRYPVWVVLVPRIERVTFRLTPPAYTGEAPREAVLTEAGIAVLAGTVVEIAVVSNRPLARGEALIERTSGERRVVALAPLAPGAREALGRLVVTHAGTLALWVEDPQRHRSRERIRVPISLVADQPPQVRLIHPRPDSRAVAKGLVPIEIEAEDDFGVARLTLVRSLNASRDRLARVALPAGPRRQVRVALALDLPPFGLAPGDTIDLWVEATDNEPNRPRTARTERARVTIVSNEEMARLAAQWMGFDELWAPYRDARRMVADLAAQLAAARRSLAAALRAGDAAQLERAWAQVERLVAALGQAAREAERLARAPMRMDIDTVLRPGLTALARGLARVATDLAGTRSSPMPAAALDRAARDLDRLAREYEEAVMAPLAALEEAFPVLDDAARFAELAVAQEQLALDIDRLDREAGPDDPAVRVRLTELAWAQEELMAELERLLGKIDHDAGRLPPRPPTSALAEEARAFVSRVRRGPIRALLVRATQALGQGDIDDARSASRGAARAMMALVVKIVASVGPDGPMWSALGFQPAILRAIGQTAAWIVGRPIAGLASGSGTRAVGGRTLGLYGERRTGSLTPFDARARPATGRRVAPPQTPIVLGDPSPGPIPPPLLGGIQAHELPLAYRAMIRAYLERLARELTGGVR